MFLSILIQGGCYIISSMSITHTQIQTRHATNKSLSASDEFISCILNFRFTVKVTIMHMVGLMMERKLFIWITVIGLVMHRDLSIRLAVVIIMGQVVVADIIHMLIHFIVSHMRLLSINELGKSARKIPDTEMTEMYLKCWEILNPFVLLCLSVATLLAWVCLERFLNQQGSHFQRSIVCLFMNGLWWNSACW